MKRVLCIGDSNTYGMDPRDSGRYDEAHRWTALLQREDRQILEHGVNGATIPTEYELPYMEQMIEQELPVDAVIVMLGTNDILCGISAEDCAASMDALLTCIKTLAPKARLLLICPPPTPLGDGDQRAIFAAQYAELQTAYRNLADQHAIEYADAGAWGIELSFDELHFSEQGHAVFAAAVNELLTQMLAQ